MSQIGRPFRVRSRPLPDPARTPSRSLRPKRAGIVAPLAVAVTLAVVGHEMSAPVPAGAVRAYEPVEAVERGDRAMIRSLTSARQSVARLQPAPAKKKAVKKRASRARTRRAVVTRAWVRPTRGGLTSGYGPRWGRMHRGIDFGAPYGTPIYAAAKGTVSYAGPEGGYGRLVTIRHAGGYTTAYGHMSRIVVRSGQRVSAGQVIAYVGSEGRSTGPHLHFEVRRGGAYLDPIPFLRARGVRV